MPLIAEPEYFAETIRQLTEWARPRETVEASYELEYGTDSLQVHRDAVPGEARVIVLDDVLATGGTARAKIELVESLGGVVAGIEFVIELSFLEARSRLDGYDVHSLTTY